jgi:hypothetical protein
MALTKISRGLLSTGVVNNTDGGIIVSTDGYGRALLLPANENGTAEDNLHYIGSSSYRWRDIYLSGAAYIGGTAAANALNDYEEGSWTPTNADSGETANMGGDSARYTKIGNMVSLRFDITNTSGNHANLIGGLPYTVKTAAHGGIFIVYNNLSTGTSAYTTGYCNAGSTYIRLTVAGGTDSWQLNNSYRIIGFGVYETDS